MICGPLLSFEFFWNKFGRFWTGLIASRSPRTARSELGDSGRRGREVTETILNALAAAWTTTMIAATLFVTVLALLHAWDPSTYVRVVLSLDLYG
jgi:hypothetical protein